MGLDADEGGERHQHAQPAHGGKEKEYDTACAHETLNHGGTKRQRRQPEQFFQQAALRVGVTPMQS
jgi:hypothetical protein